ncbi:MAG: hypothetical protein J1E61_07075 [Lachnospiraceae bacterium]|nr:hypothetical protein [Lachnospiraceae bacterium]
MRKKLWCLLLAGILLTGQAGCASKQEEVPDQTKSEEREEEKDKKDSGKYSFLNTDEEFGYQNEAYEKFRFLKAYPVDTDYRQFVLYLPDENTLCEYYEVPQPEFIAAGYAQGVSLRMIVDYNIQEGGPGSEMLEASMEENLDNFLQGALGYYYSEPAITVRDVSEMQAYGENGAIVAITYEFENNGHTTLFYLQLYMFRDGNTFYTAVVDVDSDHITDKTMDVLAEIEEYLDVDIRYDQDSISIVRKENGQPSESINIQDGVVTVNTGFWEFELPEGWDQVDGDKDGYSYAPGGIADLSNMITISEMGPGDLEFLDELTEEDSDYYMSNFVGTRDIDIKDLSVIGYKDIGFVFSYALYETGSDVSYAKIYLVEDDDFIYSIIADGEGNDAEAVKAAAYIVEHGRKAE